MTKHHRHYKKRKPRHGRVFSRVRFCLIALAVTAALFAAAVIKMLPVIARAASYQGQLYAAKIIDTAVLAELDTGTDGNGDNGTGDNGGKYSELVKITRADDGTVVSIESDAVKMGRLKGRISAGLETALTDIDGYTLNIHIGTLLGMPNFYGRGFMLPVRVIPRGYPETHIISEFTDAGVNQTMHRIILTAAVDISAIATGISTPTKTKTEYIIAETIIVGKIPNTYTHIVI